MIILYLEYEYEFEYERLNKETLLSLWFCTRLYPLFYYKLMSLKDDFESKRRMDGWVDGWMDGWMEGECREGGKKEN